MSDGFFERPRCSMIPLRHTMTYEKQRQKCFICNKMVVFTCFFDFYCGKESLLKCFQNDFELFFRERRQENIVIEQNLL